ncbi:MAG: DsbA family protein [Tissierellaceae bacterium]
MIDIKIFSDFACPFCYIGFSIAHKLKEENPNVNIQWIPYELDPNLSIRGSDLSDYIPQEQIDMSYRRIERLGKEYNLIYNNKTKKFNTNRLHKAALFARNEGKYYEFASEAFKTIFEYGKNVGESVIVNEIGLNVGLNIVEMNRCIDDGTFDKEMEDAKNLAIDYKIESVPTFIVNENRHVTILKDYERFKRDLIR